MAKPITDRRGFVAKGGAAASFMIVKPATAFSYQANSALTLGMLIGGALFYSWRQRIRTGPRLPDSARTTQFGLTIALAGVLIHALIDFPLQIASIQLYTVTLISILWSSKHWMSDTRRMQLRRMPRCQTKVLAIAS